MAPIADVSAMRFPVVAAAPAAVAVLFWVWVAVALAIWALRLARRLGVGRSVAEPTTDDVATAVRDRLSDPVGEGPADGSLAGADEPPMGGLPGTSSGTGSGRSGLFAPTPGTGPGPISDGGIRPGAARLTVVEALQGVRMPCGLSPVVDGTVSIPNPFRVAFLTTEADAATVGGSLGDELVRLGFTLSTPAATELLARKPGAELRVILHPKAVTARRGLDLLFPAAPDASVGVEIMS